MDGRRDRPSLGRRRSRLGDRAHRTSEVDVNLILRNLRTEPDDDLVARFYVEVLQPSFDQDELMDVDALARGLRADDDPHTLASVAVDERGTVMGGVIAELYESVGVLLLAYLAVRPGRRGRGVGTALAERVVPGWFADPRVAIAIGEVHDPRFWPEDKADERLRLYDRLGGRVLSVPFVQPALGPGASRVRGFLLLAFHVAPRARVVVDGRDGVRADLLARFVRRYYERVEGARPPYDAELVGLLELIERDEAIPLLPVADYEHVQPLEAGRA